MITGRSLAALLMLVVLQSPACASGSFYVVRHFTGFGAVETIGAASVFYGHSSAVNRPLTDGQPAYDYSVQLVTELSPRLHRLYSGGRWLLSANGPAWDGDHVLQHTSPTGAAGSWVMPHVPQRAEFLKGEEEGTTSSWYSRNYIEPEVVKVGGTYYMFTQVQIVPGDPIDQAGLTAVTQADRIQLHTSTNGTTWSRWSTQRGVVTNIPDPQNIMLHHQEVIYVPWDTSGRPWWMYVCINSNNTFLGYWRLRSSDPTNFDYATREVANLGELGNQIGYLKDAPGGPLFVRITSIGETGTGRRVPSLQFSRDGLAWQWGNEGAYELRGSDDNLGNRNCYFLGISTIDGTGEIEKSDTSGLRYWAYYAATTSNSPVAPDIFSSEIGHGRLDLTINPPNAAANWPAFE